MTQLWVTSEAQRSSPKLPTVLDTANIPGLNNNRGERTEKRAGGGSNMDSPWKETAAAGGQTGTMHGEKSRAGQAWRVGRKYKR